MTISSAGMSGNYRYAYNGFEFGAYTRSEVRTRVQETDDERSV